MVTAFLLLGTTVAAGGPPAPPVEPLRYELQLRIDPREPRFRGSARIDLAIDAATDLVVLNGRRLEIQQAAAYVAGGEGIFAAVEPRLAAGSYDEPEELALHFERPLPAGRALLVLDYDAPFDTQLRGLYHVREDDADYAFTQFEPADARRAFPGFDAPRFKVPFAIELVVPRGMLAFSNAPETGRTGAGEGFTAVRFAETPPLPTYLVAFAVGPLDVLEERASKGRRDPPLRVITTRNRSALGADALARTRRILAQQEAYTGIPYPYAKLDLVAVPDFAAGAMENPGLITFREEILLADARRSPSDARRKWNVIYHEIAHQYFGNLVTPCGWEEIWLNEGFASWMRSGEPDPDRAARRAETMAEDALPATLPLRREVGSTSDAIESLFNRLVFSKGAAVLEMIEGWLGPDAFRAGVRAYLSAHVHGNADSEDLYAALSAASGEDVGAVARGFLDRPGVPVVAAEVVCGSGAGPRLRLSQSGDDRWRIPVCVRHAESDGPGARCVLVTGGENEFPLGPGRCPAWLYPNHGERGYYRFALTHEGLAALTRSLDRLAPAEREGLVGNLWALAERGDLSAPALLEALDRFRRPDSAGAVLDVLERVSRTLVTPASRPEFRAWAQDLVAAIARSARETPDSAAGAAAAKPLKRDLVRTLGLVVADAATIRRAGTVAGAFLANPRKVDLETAPEMIAIASAAAGAERFEALRAVARDGGPAERVAAVRGLGGFDDPVLLGRAFDLALEGEVRAQDFRYLLVSARSDAARVAVVLGWVDRNLAALKERLPGQAAAALLGVAGELCEAADIDRAEATFAARSGEIEGGERALRTALERARRCAAVRAREGDAAAAWLAAWGVGGAAREGATRVAPDAP